MPTGERDSCWFYLLRRGRDTYITAAAAAAAAVVAATRYVEGQAQFAASCTY